MHRFMNEMRQRADWMNPIDDQIMEYLRDAGAGTPQIIAESLERNNGYVGVRCRELTKYGLLTRPAHGLYTLTEDGEDYLNEELDAKELKNRD